MTHMKKTKDLGVNVGQNVNFHISQKFSYRGATSCTPPPVNPPKREAASYDSGSYGPSPIMPLEAPPGTLPY